jgi:hypothetical protein
LLSKLLVELLEFHTMIVQGVLILFVQRLSGIGTCLTEDGENVCAVTKSNTQRHNMLNV